MLCRPCQLVVDVVVVVVLVPAGGGYQGKGNSGDDAFGGLSLGPKFPHRRDGIFLFFLPQICFSEVGLSQDLVIRSDHMFPCVFSD